MYYHEQYNELLQKAKSETATAEDRVNLCNWLNKCDPNRWTTITYLWGGVFIEPIFAGVGEPNENGWYDQYELVDAVFC